MSELVFKSRRELCLWTPGTELKWVKEGVYVGCGWQPRVEYQNQSTVRVAAQKSSSGDGRLVTQRVFPPNYFQKQV